MTTAVISRTATRTGGADRQSCWNNSWRKRPRSTCGLANTGTYLSDQPSSLPPERAGNTNVLDTVTMQEDLESI